MVCGSSIIVKNKILDDLLGPTMIASTVDESMTIVNAKIVDVFKYFLVFEMQLFETP